MTLAEQFRIYRASVADVEAALRAQLADNTLLHRTAVVAATLRRTKAGIAFAATLQAADAAAGTCSVEHMATVAPGVFSIGLDAAQMQRAREVMG